MAADFRCGPRPPRGYRYRPPVPPTSASAVSLSSSRVFPLLSFLWRPTGWAHNDQERRVMCQENWLTNTTASGYKYAYDNTGRRCGSNVGIEEETCISVCVWIYMPWPLVTAWPCPAKCLRTLGRAPRALPSGDPCPAPPILCCRWTFLHGTYIRRCRSLYNITKIPMYVYVCMYVCMYADVTSTINYLPLLILFTNIFIVHTYVYSNTIR